MNRWINMTVLTLFAVPIAGHNGLSAQEWRAIRGNNGTGSATTGGVLSTNTPFDLEIAWKRKLGSGYSSPVVVGNRVVTMFTDGQHDCVICLDSSLGTTIWKTVTGPHFQGENGSFDGPIATPLIHKAFVYALDPDGTLLCLNLADGNVVWSMDLVADEGAVKPLYGFATSPIMVDHTLVVQTGVEQKSLAGIQPDSGEILWAVSNDEINSQTPGMMTIDDKVIVLAAGGKQLTGVNPRNGDILFEYAHQGGNGSAMMPVAMDHRVLLTLDDSFSKAVSLHPAEDGKLEVTEEWQERSIKNTYNIPVLQGGKLFAYSTRILTCVDAVTGKAIWKSREPGDGFLIVVDDHLIINTKQGGVHVARATGDGYNEVAGLKLFEDLVWSIPAFSEDAIYLRSLGEVARVNLVTRGSREATSGAPILPMGPQFTRLIDFLQKHPQPRERSEAITRYLDGQSSFPILEGDVVHFVYRGPGEDVALASDIFGARQEKQMRRVEGTDFFFYTLRLKDDQRANYVFLVDYQPQTDPRNRRVVTSSMYAGEMEFAVRLRGEKPLEMSWFGMSQWREPEYLTSLPSPLRGSLEPHAVESELVEGPIHVEIYTPPDYDAKGEGRFRTVYVFGGPTVREIGKLAAAAENLFAQSDHPAHPAILVLVNATPSPKFAEAIAKDLVPFVDDNFRTKIDRQHRSLVGFGFMAGSALNTLTSHPNLFSAIAVQSPLLFDAEQSRTFAAIDKIDQPVMAYVDWGRFDMYNPHENWDVRDISQRLYNRCKAHAHFQVSGGMVNDSADWASWRNRYHHVLLLGAEE